MEKYADLPAIHTNLEELYLLELKVVAKSYFKKLSIQKVTFKVVFKVFSSIQNLTSSYLDELKVVAKSYFQKSSIQKVTFKVVLKFCHPYKT